MSSIISGVEEHLRFKMSGVKVFQWQTLSLKETIAVNLPKIIGAVGMPVAYLKDGGTDLGVAPKILDKQDLGSPSIDDISHVIANLLKHSSRKSSDV